MHMCIALGCNAARWRVVYGWCPECRLLLQCWCGGLRVGAARRHESRWIAEHQSSGPQGLPTSAFHIVPQELRIKGFSYCHSHSTVLVRGLSWCDRLQEQGSRGPRPKDYIATSIDWKRIILTITRWYRRLAAILVALSLQCRPWQPQVTM